MYNFKTNSTENIEGFPPDDRLAEFITQDPASQRMYQTLLKMGHTPKYSFCKVMDSVTSKSGTASLVDAYLARNWD